MSTEIIYLFDPETREYVGEQPNRFDALEDQWTMYPDDHASITHTPPETVLSRSGFKLIYDYDNEWKYVEDIPPEEPEITPLPVRPDDKPTDPPPKELLELIKALTKRVEALEA